MHASSSTTIQNANTSAKRRKCAQSQAVSASSACPGGCGGNTKSPKCSHGLCGVCCASTAAFCQRHPKRKGEAASQHASSIGAKVVGGSEEGAAVTGLNGASRSRDSVGEALFAQLREVDSTVVRGSYFVESTGEWDEEGIRSDIGISICRRDSEAHARAATEV